MRDAILAGRNCATSCFSIVLWLRRLGKSAPKNGSCRGSAAQDVAKLCTTPARESNLEVKIVKNWQRRSTFASSSLQNLHHACARERFGSQNRKKMVASEKFLKFTSPKFVPRLRARAFWKPIVKTPGTGDGFGG